MLILNSKQVIPCYVQLTEEEGYLPAFTYLNRSFIKRASYDKSQQEKAFKHSREFLDQDCCCVILEHREGFSLWSPAPEEAKVIEKGATDKAESNQELSSEFINYSQRVLAHYIGPMAQWVSEEALENLSSPRTRKDYIKALASEIPDSKQAQEFLEEVRKYNG